MTADSLTVLGSGIRSAPSSNFAVLSNNVRVLLTSSLVVDDGTLIIPLSRSLTTYVSQLTSLNGSRILFAVAASPVLSNALSFSMLTPLPNITGLSPVVGQGCVQTGLFTLGDCIPGVFSVTIRGQYLFPPVFVTVAGPECCTGRVAGHLHQRAGV